MLRIVRAIFFTLCRPLFGLLACLGGRDSALPEQLVQALHLALVVANNDDLVAGGLLLAHELQEILEVRGHRLEALSADAHRVRLFTLSRTVFLLPILA